MAEQNNSLSLREQYIHRYRQHSLRMPEFHHHSVPESVLSHRNFSTNLLMLEKPFLLLRFGDIHCRITYSAKFNNFKMIRPDQISNRVWHELKQAADNLVQQYLLWYATPPPHTAPLAMRKKFLLYNDDPNASRECGDNGGGAFESDHEKRQQAEENLDKERQSVQKEDGEEDDGDDDNEDDEDDDDDEEEYEKIISETRRAIQEEAVEEPPPSFLTCIEEYLERYPHMKQHPWLFAMVCGEIVPCTSHALEKLSEFRNLLRGETLHNLFCSIVECSDESVRENFGRQLIRNDIYPELIDVEGVLGYNLRFPSNRFGDALRHEQNADMLLVDLFARQTRHRHGSVPRVDEIERLLPGADSGERLYCMYDQKKRIEQLRRSRVWRDFCFPVECCRARKENQCRSVYRFGKFCGQCQLSNKRRVFIANWFQARPRPSSNAPVRKRRHGDSFEQTESRAEYKRPLKRAMHYAGDKILSQLITTKK